MKKLFTSLLLLGVALTGWATITPTWDGKGTLTVNFTPTPNNQGHVGPAELDEFKNNYQNIWNHDNLVHFDPATGEYNADVNYDVNANIKGKVTKLVLEGAGFTNKDFNGGKMGDFIATCAGQNTLYLDLTNASGLISKVTYTTTSKNPVKDAQYVYSNEEERKNLISKTSYYLPNGNPVPQYAIDQNMLRNDGNGNYWLENFEGNPRVDVTYQEEYGYYGEYWGSNPNPGSWVTVTNYQTDPNTGEKYVMVAKNGTAFAFGNIDQNNHVVENYCGKYLNGITFPKGDNFTAIPDKLCCTALCPYLETVVWGDQLTWIGEHAFRGGVNDNGTFSPASELKYIGIMDSEGNVTFPTIKLPNTEGGLTDVNEGVVKFPNTLEVIGLDAFYECTDFRYVNLDLENLVKVDAAAFNMYQDNINQLDSVQMPSKANTSLKFWGNQVFSSSHIKTLDFRYCEGIKHFAYDGTDSMEEGTYNPTTGGVGSNTFYWFSDLKELILPPNLKSIAGGQTSSIVYNCNKLETLRFTGTAEFGEDNEGNPTLKNGFVVPQQAFYSHPSLKNLYFAENSNVSQIDENAFDDCKKLEKVYFGGRGRYQDCELINPLRIEKKAFQACSLLSDLTLSNNVSFIGEHSFKQVALTTVSIPASVEEIETQAFYKCVNLTTVIFEEFDKNLGTCDGAETIIAGGSDQGHGAFEECQAITDVYINTKALLHCDNNAFDQDISWGAGDPGSNFATLHFPEENIDNYVNLKHYLTDEIAADDDKFHDWLMEHYDLAGVPHKNGWYEFVNSGPSKGTKETPTEDIILRTFSDYKYSYLVPDGLRAYAITGFEQDGATYVATLERLNVIPAQTGVILYGHPNGRTQSGEPTITLTPVHFVKIGDPVYKTVDGELVEDHKYGDLPEEAAKGDQGLPLCRANWGKNLIQNYLEPTSTLTQAYINTITDEDKKEALEELLAQHPEWQDGGIYVKPFENKNDVWNKVDTRLSNPVTFRNFGFNRYSRIINIENKIALDQDGDVDYAAFFRCVPGTRSSGKAYLHVSADEFPLSDGAQILVKEDRTTKTVTVDGEEVEEEVSAYYWEIEPKSGDPYNARLAANADYNKKGWWNPLQGFDWNVVDDRFAYIDENGSFVLDENGNKIIKSRMNWGACPARLKDIRHAPRFMGEFEEADGIVKTIIPADTNLDNEYYTIQGVKVKNPSKGVYICNGKKVVIK